MEQIVIIEPNEEELGKSISQIVRLKPNHCKFPVTGLPWHVTQYPEAVISEQSRGLMGANMQLFEFYAKKNISLSFRKTHVLSHLWTSHPLPDEIKTWTSCNTGDCARTNLVIYNRRTNISF